MRKSIKNSVKVINIPQVNLKMSSHVHLLVESFCIVFEKYILRQSFRLNLVLNFFLIFDQLSGSCSYKIVPIETRERLVVAEWSETSKVELIERTRNRKLWHDMIERERER